MRFKTVAGFFLPHAGTIPIPVVEIPLNPQDDAWIQSLTTTADAVVQQLPVERKCIVLTYVPYTGGNPLITRRIAESLGLPYLVFNLDNLMTLEGSHLDTISSERWSKEFFSRLEPWFATCLGR